MNGVYDGGKSSLGGVRRTLHVDASGARLQRVRTMGSDLMTCVPREKSSELGRAARCKQLDMVEYATMGGVHKQSRGPFGNLRCQTRTEMGDERNCPA